MASIQSFFTKEEKADIINAIKKAELNTSGEIRLHVENKLKGDLMDRAAYVFKELNMQKTDLRNGVLFYLAVKSQKFAILGDAGINKVVPDNFWDDIKEVILKDFKEGDYAQGLIKGVEMAGEQLKEFFPYQSDDVNELSDDISYGK